MQYCAQIAIPLEGFEWENPIWIVWFIGCKPSVGLKSSHACSSVTSAARAGKFGRVVLQAWLDLQHKTRQPSDLCPMAGELLWCQVSEPTLKDPGICAWNHLHLQ